MVRVLDVKFLERLLERFLKARQSFLAARSSPSWCSIDLLLRRWYIRLYVDTRRGIWLVYLLWTRPSLRNITFENDDSAWTQLFTLKHYILYVWKRKTVFGLALRLQFAPFLLPNANAVMHQRSTQLYSGVQSETHGVCTYTSLYSSTLDWDTSECRWRVGQLSSHLLI